MTPNQVVTQGLKKIGVGLEGESISGAEMEDGITLLNQMLHLWELEGINLQHYDATSGSEIPLPQNHDIGLVYNFAVFAAPEYEASVSQEVAVIATNSKSALRNAYLDPNARLPLDNALKVQRFNINNGEY